MVRIRATIAALSILSMQAPAILAQGGDAGKLNLSTGRDIFRAACVACHGPDGKGAADTTVGFEKPATFPDFSQCNGTTPELDVDWKATIRDGGHGRGFSPIMPSFAEALTSRQMDLVITYLRGLCRDNSWPRGELNLPRSIATEKAFPEDETVITTAVNAQGAPGISNELVYEHRLGVRNQIEASVPFGFAHDTDRWLGGVGDIGFGLKRVLFSSLRTGSILSVQGEAILPTGAKSKGLGSGVTTFEGFAAYGQLLPAQWFLQAQAGTDQPTHTDTAPRALFWRASLGKSYRQGMGLGRLWSPMVELLADRDLETGARTNWDVLPQFQVTLSQRQHIRADIGIRIPATNTVGRPVQVVFYLLWDWFDGGLLEGWK
jgi:mono/diheme cytochrome c family protein